MARHLNQVRLRLAEQTETAARPIAIYVQDKATVLNEEGEGGATTLLRDLMFRVEKKEGQVLTDATKEL